MKNLIAVIILLLSVNVVDAQITNRMRDKVNKPRNGKVTDKPLYKRNSDKQIYKTYSSTEVLRMSCIKIGELPIENFKQTYFAEKKQNSKRALHKLLSCFNCEEQADFLRKTTRYDLLWESSRNRFLAQINNSTERRKIKENIEKCFGEGNRVEVEGDTGGTGKVNSSNAPWLYTATCQQIENSNTQNLVRNINGLIRGSTLDDDELAILKVFSCLPCEKTRSIVQKVGKEKLESDMHGEEYTRLLEFFKECDIVSSENDELSRHQINTMSHEQLNSYSQEDHIRLINSMLSGSTDNGDERAIISLLNRLSPKEKRKKVILGVGVQRLEDNFHGAEYDHLLIILLNLGLVDFSSFDDDAALVYIERYSCRFLKELSVEDARVLLWKLFRGSTGDREERAINKVVDCLSAQKVKKLVRTNGFSVDDFDGEVDGSEWDQLEGIFRRKGVRVD